MKGYAAHRCHSDPQKALSEHPLACVLRLSWQGRKNRTSLQLDFVPLPASGDPLLSPTTERPASLVPRRVLRSVLFSRLSTGSIEGADQKYESSHT